MLNYLNWNPSEFQHELKNSSAKARGITSGKPMRQPANPVESRPHSSPTADLWLAEHQNERNADVWGIRKCHVNHKVK